MYRPHANRWLRFTAGTTLVTLAACASTTTIQSVPSGARLYLNGEAVGSTPYTMTDTKIIGTATTVRLETPGHETFSAVITRNEEFSAGACAGGVFLLFPFLWVMGYKPLHNYELRPLGGQAAGYPSADSWTPAPPSGPPPAGYPPPPPAGHAPPGGAAAPPPAGPPPAAPPPRAPKKP